MKRQPSSDVKKNNGTGTHFMWENRDIRYNVLRAVGYYKGKPVAEDLILLNGLEQAPNLELLYQDDKKILKGRQDIIICIVSTVEGMIIQIVSDSSGCRTIRIIPCSWAKNFKDLNPYLASQRTTNDPIRGTRDWTLFNISASDVISWNIVSLWQTEHIVLNCISQSLGMVRAGSASADCEGLRIFDVAVNDSVVLDDLDIWAESGHDGVCKKVVYATVKGGDVENSFPGSESRTSLDFRHCYCQHRSGN